MSQVNEISFFDGSYYAHRSYHRAAQFLKRDKFDSDESYFEAMVGKTFEICIQSLSIDLEMYNVDYAVYLLDTDVASLINTRKVVADHTEDSRYQIVNATRKRLAAALPYMSVTPIGMAGLEADDFAYLLAHMTPKMLRKLFKLRGDWTARMVSNDYDWLQGVTPTCVWCRSSDRTITTNEDMANQYGGDPSNISWRLAYVSEQCMTRVKDGNLGIDGIGAKGAEQVRNLFFDRMSGQPSQPANGTALPAPARKVLDQWDQFVANWSNIDGEWINSTYWPDSDQLVSSVMIQHVRSQVDAALPYRTKTLNQLEWLSKIQAKAGEAPKLGAAVRRVTGYKVKSYEATATD